MGRLVIGTQELACLVCEGERFLRRRLVASSGVVTGFAKVPDQEIEGYECGQCGHIHWFSPTTDE